MTFVLIHGGAHGAWCWDPLIPHLDGNALAVDLPGRGAKPAELEKIGVADWVASVVEDIEGAGLGRVILVGHSLAGITMPVVAERIPDRIAHLVFLSCSVPREGGCVVDALSGGVQSLTQENLREGRTELLAEDVARQMFCNDMDEVQTRFVLDNLCPEAARPLVEPTSLAGLIPELPRTYVKLLRDQTLPPDLQDVFIRNMGGAVVRLLDAGHDAMISAPRALAAILNEIRAQALA
jgi:pimeloyl-ACP methyl ester carboxylesterase